MPLTVEQKREIEAMIHSVGQAERALLQERDNIFAILRMDERINDDAKTASLLDASKQAIADACMEIVGIVTPQE